MSRALALALTLCAGPLWALELQLPPNARQTVERNTAPDIYQAPLSVFADGDISSTRLEGAVERRVWRMASPGLSPLQVVQPLRAQLEAAGFEIALDCSAAQCGGFDFRFGTETLPGPNMFVNIQSFHFVTALRGAPETPSEAITLFASSSASAAYVQIIHANTGESAPISVEPRPTKPVAKVDTVPRGGFAERLERQGFAILPGLEFASGSAELGDAPVPALEQLAAFLQARPGLRVALVGHTDTVGSLAGNISISRARAQSVRQRLIDQFSVSPDRLDAEGMGYLSPIASNLDQAGRDKNRRVEVVLLSEN